MGIYCLFTHSRCLVEKIGTVLHVYNIQISFYDSSLKVTEGIGERKCKLGFYSFPLCYVSI